MPPDYSGQNLRGRSFKGQNLEGANFSYADIRGTDFTGANLRGTDFTGAKAGLQKRWVLLLVLLSLLLWAMSGILFLLNWWTISSVFDSNYGFYNQVGSWAVLIVIINLYTIIFRQGIGVILTFSGTLAGIIVGAFSTFIIQAIYLFGCRITVEAPAEGSNEHVAIAQIEVPPTDAIYRGAVGGALAVVGIFVLAVAVALIGAVDGVFAAVFVLAVAATVSIGVAFTGIFAVVFLAGTIISAYMAWRAMKGDEKYTLIRNVAVAIAAIGGTSFRGADLTDADFTAAQLKSTDLRKAKLIRTCFHKTKLLDRVRPGDSYLQYPQVRQLILTGQGQDKNFDRFKLRGINLKEALLTDASFIHTDLTHACLQDADLSRAKLAKTQLHNTNFTGATLTGMYIGHWNISNETNFCGVKCEYIYTRLPTKENPNPLRKPDNNAEVFADGEFGDFIQPIFDTLDLYHNQGVDPRAIAISFKELAENNPDAELEIVAMEKRGGDKLLLRAKTASSVDKSELSGEYFEIYNQVKAVAEQEVKALMMEKDNRICSLETMVNIALQSPKFYATGDNKMSGDNIQQEGSFGVGVNKREIKAEKIAGTINEAQQQSITEAAAEIQALLEQLDKTYSTDTTTGKMALATEAIAQIEANPTLAARILSALKTGGIKAFEKFLSHPAASFVAGALEDWQKTKG